MTNEDFLSHYPHLFHVAEAGSWSSIRKFGLESTSALLDRFEITGPRREAIEFQRRPTSEILEHDIFGTAVIRDQGPISETKLANCLVGMTTAEWYKILNGLVFLWPWSERRNGMLRSYSQQNHDVITFDSQRLLAHHGDKIVVSPINSGSTIHRPAKRGRDTFVRLCDCPFTDWRQRCKKKPQEVIAEVALPYRLDNIEQFVLRVESFSGERCTGVLWES